MPLADAAIATEIATVAARGRGADRAPTLEQLLAAFGETSPTPAARARVAAALRVAGMGVKPDLASAEPGQRLLLLPPGVSEGRSRGRAFLGILGVAAVLVAAAVGASALQGGGGDDDVASNLPAGETSTTTTPSSSAAVPGTTETTDTGTTDTGTTPTDTTATETTSTDSTSTETTDTTATDTTSADEQAAAERRRKAAAKRRQEREAAAKRKAAAASKLVTVRVDASGRPTFLCVDDGSGQVLFSGTLDGKKVFKSERVRMNIGLKSTYITVNGNPITLTSSPAGLDITRKGGARELPLGSRPCG
ncbi:MAG TPA: hypothetical protein VFG42_11560 [Baekduia sp.]|uniref:hypothetical protein n=1 Tax=Baekduia sp. TaxID=2600305 RepID=UPI002D793A2F|nr:hypothetical protein [Baekduia sp.]HET6507415.1 hypothetical protein [Baekduia sp.]